MPTPYIEAQFIAAVAQVGRTLNEPGESCNGIGGNGDRVEIYRPITCDPKTVPRKAKGGDAAED
ncbi:MAG: RnfH family protein [Gallionella sp.]|nr:RnfH family protein [Gallionella sp.]